LHVRNVITVWQKGEQGESKKISRGGLFELKSGPRVSEQQTLRRKRCKKGHRSATQQTCRDITEIAAGRAEGRSRGSPVGEKKAEYDELHLRN